MDKNCISRSYRKTQSLKTDLIQLNVHPDDDKILRCHGRIKGEFPIYLPDDALFIVKLVEHAHLETLHGGVILSMAKVRERYWVPRLRQLFQKPRKRCYRCKRLTTKPYQAPIPAALPKTRTEGTTPYKVICLDFAGPIRKKNQEGKACLWCSFPVVWREKSILKCWRVLRELRSYKV